MRVKGGVRLRVRVNVNVNLVRAMVMVRTHLSLESLLGGDRHEIELTELR